MTLQNQIPANEQDGIRTPEIRVPRGEAGTRKQGYFNKVSVSVVEFYSNQLGIHLAGNGWIKAGLCPFHHDTHAGNFRINMQHGGFMCFACNSKGGDVIDFLCLLNRWDYKQAVSYLSDTIWVSKTRQPVKRLDDPDPVIPGLALNNQWQAALPADSNHQYLVSKRIKAFGIRQSGRNLLIPVYGTNGLLCGIQNIGEQGNKWFTKDSRIKGNFFLVGEVSNTLVICEGFSTGATLHQQSGYQVAVAFHAGNLEPVAVAIREQYPDRQIIIAADNDRYQKDGTPRTNNPGLEAATKAAERINARLAVPEFPDGVMGSDFNDLANLEVMV